MVCAVPSEQSAGCVLRIRSARAGASRHASDESTWIRHHAPNDYEFLPGSHGLLSLFLDDPAVMRQPPTYTSWKITCGSAEEAGVLQHWLSSRIDLDRVLTDTVRVSPNGVEQVQTVPHRLGDHFAAIRILPDSQANPASFRLVFHRQPEAGRFWKDLMVNILQEIETTPQKAAIDLESKGEMEPTSSSSMP